MYEDLHCALVLHTQVRKKEAEDTQGEEEAQINNRDRTALEKTYTEKVKEHEGIGLV